MEVVDVHLLLHGPQPHVVRCAVGHAALHAAAREPHRVAPRVVIAALSLLAHGHAAELAAPDDEGIVEEAAAPEVAEQPGDGPVRPAAVETVVLLDVLVGVPASGVARVELHEAHSPLDHAPGEETARAELVGVLLADAVEAAGRLALAAQVDHLRRGGLHAEGQLVGVDPGGEVAVEIAFFQVARVDAAHEVERPALRPTGEAAGRAQVDDGLATAAHERTLVRRRQKAVGPGGRAALRRAAGVRQHDVGRHVPVLGAEAVAQPAAEARLAHEDAAGVHLVDRLRVVDAVTVAAPDDAQLVRALRQVVEEVADLESRFAAWPERPDGAEKGVAGHLPPGHDLSKALRERLTRVASEGRLGVEEVDVARSAVHEEVDHSLRARPEVRPPRSQGRSPAPGGVVPFRRGARQQPVLVKERRQGHRAEPAAGAEEEVASGSPETHFPERKVGTAKRASGQGIRVAHDQHS